MLLPCLCFGPMFMALIGYLLNRCQKNASGRNPGDDGGTSRLKYFAGFTGLLTLAGSLFLWPQTVTFNVEGFCGFGLHLRADGFRSLYTTVAAFMWTMTGLFSPEYFAHYHNRSRYYFFNLLTLGATIGVFLSDDLYTTFVFFEIMSLASYPWVAHEETPDAMRAAGTYLAVAVIGGLTTLMGLFLLWHELGTLSFDGMQQAMQVRNTDNGLITCAAWLTVFGFAAKAGMFPLHIWLPKAHPVAPAPASALLSGILTKSGVFGLAVVCSRLMQGNEAFGHLLMIFAAITMFVGAVLALLSVNLKRTLACSSMSQIGFIGIGLSMAVLSGEEGSLAVYGTVMHMLNHSLIKLVLFMCAGVIYMNLHRLDLNEVRGFGRGKPVLHIAFLLGAVSIGCLPFVGSGFASKSLLHESILEYMEMAAEKGLPVGQYRFLELLFIFSGGLTIAYMTKLYICIFWEKHPQKQEKYDAMKKTYINGISAAVLLISAVMLPILALFPGIFMTAAGDRSVSFFAQSPLKETIHYFSGENLLGAAWSILAGTLTYLLIVRPLLMRRETGIRTYVNCLPSWLDMEDRIYRPFLLKILPTLFGGITACLADLPVRVLKIGPLLGKCASFMADLPARILKLGPVLGIFVSFLAGLPERCLKLGQIMSDAVRMLAEIPECIVLLSHKTVFHESREPAPLPVDNRVAYGLGKALDGVSQALNATVRHKKPIEKNFEYRLDADWHTLYRGLGFNMNSVSFGILLLAVGLCAVCLYLILK